MNAEQEQIMRMDIAKEKLRAAVSNFMFYATGIRDLCVDGADSERRMNEYVEAVNTHTLGVLAGMDGLMNLYAGRAEEKV